MKRSPLIWYKYKHLLLHCTVQCMTEGPLWNSLERERERACLNFSFLFFFWHEEFFSTICNVGVSSKCSMACLENVQPKSRPQGRSSHEPQNLLLQRLRRILPFPFTAAEFGRRHRLQGRTRLLRFRVFRRQLLHDACRRAALQEKITSPPQGRLQQ